MSIKARLFIILYMMVAATLLIQGGAYFALRQLEASLKTMYADRVVPLRDLKLIADAYAVKIVDTAHKARAQTMTMPQALQSVEEANATIAKSWNAYMATYLTPEEDGLAKIAARNMQVADLSVVKLMDILKAGDHAALVNYVEHVMYPEIEPVADGISQLTELQLRVSAEINAGAEATNKIVHNVQVGVLLALIVLVGFANRVTRLRIARPLSAMTSAMMEVARGDISKPTPCLGQKDEIGKLADALEVFKQNKQEADRLAALQAEEERRKQQRQQSLDQAIRDFDAEAKQSVSILASAATELNASAETLTATATSLEAQSGSVSGAAGIMASNVQTVAAAVTEMNASVEEISRNLSRSATTTTRAVADIDDANHKVISLAEAARRIGDVVTLISEIAAQTNLLALNATIEAARAGEAGKGFAVVASEVKNLASQTAKATEDISGQVGAIQLATDQAVAAIGQITGIMGEINQITSGISSAVEEQTAVTRDIAENVNKTSDGAGSVSRGIAEVSVAAKDVGHSATEVETAAGNVGRQSEHLKMQILAFFERVRAA